MKGIDYLRDKLNVYRRRALYRQKVYDMKNEDISPGITIPPKLRQQYKATLGWGAKAVDSLAEAVQKGKNSVGEAIRNWDGWLFALITLLVLLLKYI